MRKNESERKPVKVDSLCHAETLESQFGFLCSSVRLGDSSLWPLDGDDGDGRSCDRVFHLSFSLARERKT